MLRAGYHDKNIVVQILIESFDTNKSVNFTVRQDYRRKERIRILMEYSFEIAMKFGIVFLSEDRKACALILFPDKKKMTIGSIWLDFKLAFLSIGFSRVGKVLRKEKMVRANHPSEPILHLWYIGVMISKQGRGIGKKMLGEIINLAHEMNRPIYLETSMDKNLPFYQKMNFEIYNEIDLSYKLYLLRRK